MGRERDRVEALQRHAVDQAVVDGYRRVPTTAAEEATAVASILEAIADEPW